MEGKIKNSPKAEEKMRPAGLGHKSKT